MEIVEKKLGAEGELNLEFKEGKICLTISYDGKGVDGGVFANIEPAYFMEKLKTAIPGKIDDVIIDGLTAAFLVSSSPKE